MGDKITHEEAFANLNKAWNEFFLAVCKAFKIDVAVDWLSKRLKNADPSS